VKKGRRIGCATFGTIWALLIVATFSVGAMGDCLGDEACNRAHSIRMTLLLGTEFAVLIVVGIFFYLREMKDGEL
jgi:hypothetical protein